jgi:hypothetical protein
VVIANAIAVGGDAEARHAFHEARGQTAETTIAERGIGLGRSQAVGIDAEIAERRARDVGEAEIAQDVGEQTADQEFEREIVDALLALGIALALGG